MRGINPSMPFVGLALRICVGILVSAALAISEPVWSATPAAHSPADRGRAQHGLDVFRVPGSSHSVFLPLEERRLLAWTNQERARRGLPPLAFNASLRAAARAQARDMALWGYIGHISRYGLGVRDRLTLYLRPGRRIGENLAFVQSVEQGHGAFVRSVAHRHNLLDPAFRRVGIGVATAGEAGMVMIAEEFTDVASPRLQRSPYRASPIRSERRASSASTAPVGASRSGR